MLLRCFDMFRLSEVLLFLALYRVLVDSYCVMYYTNMSMLRTQYNHTQCVVTFYIRQPLEGDVDLTLYLAINR